MIERSDLVAGVRDGDSEKIQKVLYERFLKYAKDPADPLAAEFLRLRTQEQTGDDNNAG